MILIMLKEMPQLEIARIHGNIDNPETINFLAQKSMFKTKEDLFKVLDFKFPKPWDGTVSYDYIPKTSFSNSNDLDSFKNIRKDE